MRNKIYKFKTLKEARKFNDEEFIRNKFDYKKAKEFFEKYFVEKGEKKNIHKPGIYKFKTLKEAREFDLRQMIKHSF